MRILIGLIILFGLLLTSGCGSNAANVTPSAATQPITTSATSLPSEGGTSMTPSVPAPLDPNLQKLVDMTKEDLAQRLALSVTQIKLIEIAGAEWSDSSLGCPQPGMEYLQVITPGYLILLESNGMQYEYHSNRDTYVVYCENSSPPLLPTP